MAKIFNGMIPFASAIQPTGAQPLDDRVVVATMADLIDATTFGDAKYNGMLVAVVETQQVYMLVDDANSTSSDSWVQVGTDFSGDITALDGRIDNLETFKTAVDTKLNISNNSALEFDENGAFEVKIAKDTNGFINGIERDSDGALKVATYNLAAKANVESGYAAQYEFKVNGNTVTTINIPKDQFLKNAEFIASLSVEDATTYGLESGKPYLKFT